MSLLRPHAPTNAFGTHSRILSHPALCGMRGFASASLSRPVVGATPPTAALRRPVVGTIALRWRPSEVQVRLESTQSKRDEASSKVPSIPPPPPKGDASQASIKELLSLAKPQWRLLTVGIICLAISTSVALAVPYIIGRIIDFFAPGSEQQLLFGLPLDQAAIALAALLLFGAVANSARSIALRLAGQRTVAQIRNKTYRQYLALPPSHIESAGVGDALSRLGQDSSIVGQSLSENLGEGLKAILASGVGVGAMYLISPKLCVVMMCLFPPISIASFYYGRYIRTLSLNTQEALGNMSKLAEERLSAHRTVTASNTQPAERALFAGRVQSVFDLQRKETFANGIFQGTNEVAGDLAMIGLLIYGGLLVQRGEITVGDMTTSLIYVNWIEWSLNSKP